MPLSPARKATAIAVPSALVAGAVTAWLISQNMGDAQAGSGPVTSVSVQEAQGTEDQCANVVVALPAQLEDRAKRAVKGHPGALAWGEPPITLVCGVPKPDTVESATNLTAVNGVTWMTTQDIDTSAYGLPGKNVLWTALDREVYVSVAVPTASSGSAVISPISKVLAERLKSTGA
ncbi:DUF3515 domain-containing protein [Cumulibacter manganitolerans]|uniref:DUF3515 domain-containing protein n=1 Tax=Cumulibacter manganitolerans TaxID=1884992 RepID=UPI0012956BE9|nr:DUF3515 domain-containing protein [Cumulibacter manganitolerans]